MKVKVGQYARTKENEIVKILKINKWQSHIDLPKDEYTHFTITIDKKMLYTGFIDIRTDYDIIKIADDPRELIEVGDLIVCDKYFPTPRVINEDACKQLLSEYWKPFISKILTPNSNDGYDLQWRKENES